MHNSLVNEFMYIYICICMYIFIHRIQYISYYILCKFAHTIYFKYFLLSFHLLYIFVFTLYFFNSFSHYSNNFYLDIFFRLWKSLFHLTIIGICMLNSLHLLFPNELYVFSLSGIAVVYAILNNILIR